MSKHFRNELKSSLIIPVGWLFADLLLALAMLFLVANTIGATTKAKPISTPTPIPKPTVSPTVTPSPRLELTKHRTTLNVDPIGLLNDSADAIQHVEQQFTAGPFLSLLHGRCVGFVVALGGALNGDPDIATNVAGKVYNILRRLNKDRYTSAFKMATYYDPLFTGFYPPDEVVLDIYLFSKETHDCYT